MNLTVKMLGYTHQRTSVDGSGGLTETITQESVLTNENPNEELVTLV